ncbi:hypothetical protein ABEB36_015804 [Hypothenemus hampei]|uniref:Uncharacterized protein n=1 Tax=Hypothenemus hampei TaxID=57062 RepID=A0ABD1E199_HYPHA
MNVKLVIIGDSAVGKTCFVSSCLTNSFLENYLPTVFDEYIGHVTFNEIPITLNLWDTSGRKKYDRIRNFCYYDTNVFIIQFSLIDYASFTNVWEKWYQEIKRYCQNTPIILLGTKMDLKKDKITIRNLKEQKRAPITYRQGLKMARKINAVKYLECSALNQEGVKTVLDDAIKAALSQVIVVPKPKCICTLL